MQNLGLEFFRFQREKENQRMSMRNLCLEFFDSVRERGREQWQETASGKKRTEE